MGTPVSRSDRSAADLVPLDTQVFGRAAEREAPTVEPSAVDPVVPDTGPSPLISELQSSRMGVWGETFTRRDLTAGPVLGRGFASVDEATAWAGLLLVEHGTDGAAVVETTDGFAVVALEVESWVGRRFDRSSVEGGFDSLEVESRLEGKVRAFVTSDGYRAPLTRPDRGLGGRPSYVVEQGRAGRNWQATTLPPPEAFAGIVEARSKGQLRDVDPAAARAVFQTMVRSEALSRLDANLREIEAEKGRLAGGDRAAFLRLRAAIEADQALAARAAAVEEHIADAFAAEVHRADLMDPSAFSTELQPLRG